MPNPPEPTLREVVLAAAREFNAGRYFEAHEALEDGLDAVPDDLWELFVGLIQIAVGYHKLTQGLWSGALAMFEKALAKVEGAAPDAGEIELELLRRRVRTDLESLRHGSFDASTLLQSPPRLLPRAL